MVTPLLPAALVIAGPQTATALDGVNAMRWEERVLLVFAPGERVAALDAQRKIIGAAKTGFGDRHLRLVEVVGESVSGARDYAPRLRQRYRIDPEDFVAVLVGKDGQVKLRVNRPIDAEQLFETIDAMPIRCAEIVRPASQTAVFP